MTLRTRADFRAASGVLLVLREPPPPPPPAPGQPPMVPGNPAEGAEILLAVWADGTATALHGHVDLGTGIRTALAQVAAEELELPVDRVQVVLGDTGSTPNQGPTIASATLQIHAAPLRQAAAQARAWLCAQAGGAEPDPHALLEGRHVELWLDPQAPTKDPAGYRVVGHDVPRVDIPAKATGQPVFVHDHRVPGMLHGRVVRPPYAGVDAGDFVGRTLESVDEGSVAHLPGVLKIVVQGDFVGVVAEREEQAEAAMHALHVRWKDWPARPPLHDLAAAISAHPSTPRIVATQGDVEQGIAGAAQTLQRRYVWPYQLHASIGPSCAVADWRGDGLTVWAGTQNPHVLRADLALLTGLPDTAVEVVRLEAAGCYGRNGADDVAADAALLSRACGRPVRVQLTREQESLWEPKGAAQLMDVNGGLQADGRPAAYDFQTSYPSNAAPTLALLLTRTVDPVAQAYAMGDRTSVPPYDYPHLRVTVHDMAPILRASWLRGVSALPNSFAHESYVDELATAAGADPVDYRLSLLKDDRAAELVRATAARAGWIPHAAPRQQPPQGDWLQGQGFAYARYVHSKFPGYGAAWAAWVADVEVHRDSGEVHVKRIVVGHDAGLMINPAGVRQQVHGNVLQTTSRALLEQLPTDPATQLPQARDWGAYPLLSFRQVPVVEVLTMPRPGEPPLGAGESSSVPGTAAIANAIFDATGVRFRQPPFTAEVVRAALHPLPAPASAPPAAAPAAAPLPAQAAWPRAKPWLQRLAAVGVGVVGTLAAMAGWRPAIAPIARPDAATYSAATIERGRQLAAIGDCAVCHTAPGGAPMAGGRVIDTPFGGVPSTNLTPDPDTGLGAWSLPAFQRAMRHGISRDGRHLYPAFPYTAYTHLTDDDLTALYAWLMTLPAVRQATPAATLGFPYAWRPLMALWNALHLQPGPLPPDPARSAAWNRGRDLVEGAGHCGACHTPRSALGAERSGQAHLAGATVDGWYAPPLTALSPAPVPWTEEAFYGYLRRGHHADHGAALGPMAEVVRELATVPDEDLRAMAQYLASFNAPAETAARQREAALAAIPAAARAATAAPVAMDRFVQAACGACHHDGQGPEVFGVNIPLALSTKLHADTPDNLLRVILDGVRLPPSAEVGYMPAFRDAYGDRQIADLAAHLRLRHAPGRPAWQDLEATVARLRAER